MGVLEPNFHLLASDEYDAGMSPRWPSADRITLDDELDLLEPVIARAGRRFMLVGHSYGGAIALKAALAHRDRVTAVVLYEPTLFSLVEQEQERPNEADGIRRTIIEAGLALDFGDPAAAAEIFIDYWGGAGSFAAMPEPRRAAIARSIVNIRRWGHALICEPMPIGALRRLRMPILVMTGEKSRTPAKAVARILARELPNVTSLSLRDCGHMGPVTHPDLVNGAIAAFLERHSPQAASAKAA
jgi:pimeloyl-ACP methyl ester carboxylesterase